MNNSIDHSNVEKIKTNKIIGEIKSYSSTIDIEEFIIELNELTSEAKIGNYSNIKIQFGQEHGDSEHDGYQFLTMLGDHLETEEDWHRRLLDNKERNQRMLDNAKKIVGNAKQIEEKNAKIDKALETSSLKCEKCNKPTIYITRLATWEKSRRLCTECLKPYMNIETEYEIK